VTQCGSAPCTAPCPSTPPTRECHGYANATVSGTKVGTSPCIPPTGKPRNGTWYSLPSAGECTTRDCEVGVDGFWRVVSVDKLANLSCVREHGCALGSCSAAAFTQALASCPDTCTPRCDTCNGVIEKMKQQMAGVCTPDGRMAFNRQDCISCLSANAEIDGEVAGQTNGQSHATASAANSSTVSSTSSYFVFDGGDGVWRCETPSHGSIWDVGLTDVSQCSCEYGAPKTPHWPSCTPAPPPGLCGEGGDLCYFHEPHVPPEHEGYCCCEGLSCVEGSCSH